MDWFIKAFIRASLLWFAAGVILVAGFLTLLVFGVGYQLLPRLFGAPLYSRRLGIAHLFLANLGLAGLVAGFLLPPWGPGLLAVGGTLYALGALCWVWNLWRTFDAAESRQRPPGPPGRVLPTREE